MGRVEGGSICIAELNNTLEAEVAAKRNKTVFVVGLNYLGIDAHDVR